MSDNEMQYYDFEVAVPGEPGTAYLTAPTRKTGTIGFFPTIFSVNLFDLYENSPDKLPAGAIQTRKDYDFHTFTIRTNLQSGEGVRGAETFRVAAKILTNLGEPVNELQLDSVGPKTEWKDKAVSGEIKLSIDTDRVTGALKLIPVIGEVASSVVPGIDGSFTYKWNPQVAAVISGSEGSGASWKFERTNGEYLDGDHDLVAILRRPRNLVGPLTVQIWEASAKFDVAWSTRESHPRHALINIPLQITESSPE